MRVYILCVVSSSLTLLLSLDANLPFQIASHQCVCFMWPWSIRYLRCSVHSHRQANNVAVMSCWCFSNVFSENSVKWTTHLHFSFYTVSDASPGRSEWNAHWKKLRVFFCCQHMPHNYISRKCVSIFFCSLLFLLNHFFCPPRRVSILWIVGFTQPLKVAPSSTNVVAVIDILRYILYFAHLLSGSRILILPKKFKRNRVKLIFSHCIHM